MVGRPAKSAAQKPALLQKIGFSLEISASGDASSTR